MIIGLTGQTGAGKSTVSGIIRRRGYSVLDADLAARDVAQAGSPCLAELVRAFGDEILNPDGSLNRQRLAQIAFPNKAKREKLNKITHPHIIEKIMYEAETLLKNGAKAVFIDAPTLFESGADSLCDKIISVTAPESLRLGRVLSRDGLTMDDALARMSAQHDDDFYASRSDFVIVNGGGKKELAKAVGEVLAALQIPDGGGK